MAERRSSYSSSTSDVESANAITNPVQVSTRSGDGKTGTDMILLRNNKEVSAKFTPGSTIEDSTPSNHRSVLTDVAHTTIENSALQRFISHYEVLAVASTHLGKHDRCEKDSNISSKVQHIAADGLTDIMRFYAESSEEGDSPGSAACHWKWSVRDNIASCSVQPGGVRTDSHGSSISPTNVFCMKPPPGKPIRDNNSGLRIKPRGYFLTGSGSAVNCYMYLDLDEESSTVKMTESITVHEPVINEKTIAYCIRNGTVTTFYFRCNNICYVIKPNLDDNQLVGIKTDSLENGYRWKVENLT